jgi:hypothetical protein
MFISTGTQGGGQESTAISCMSTLTHHGFIYVPLGYKTTFCTSPASSVLWDDAANTILAMLANLEEVHGGSPWGAGTFSAGDGSRQPSKLELDIATAQGKAFYEAVAKAHAWLDGSAEKKESVLTDRTKETNGGAAAPATTTAAPATTPAASGAQEKTSKDSEGPCGLPAKCDIM